MILGHFWASLYLWLSIAPQPAFLPIGCWRLCMHAPCTAACIALSHQFRKDLAWFRQYLPQTTGVFLIHEDSTAPISLFVDACTTGCRAVIAGQAYHKVSPPPTSSTKICLSHLEALNALVVVKVWVPHFRGHLVHLFSDNATAVAIFQTGRGRDVFIQVCARELWLICTAWDITLAVGHVPGLSLEDIADALSRWHLDHPYKERVDRLLTCHNIRCISVPDHFFDLAQDL